MKSHHDLYVMLRALHPEVDAARFGISWDLFDPEDDPDNATVYRAQVSLAGKTPLEDMSVVTRTHEFRADKNDSLEQGLSASFAGLARMLRAELDDTERRMRKARERLTR
jgi:hypothetical protein